MKRIQSIDFVRGIVMIIMVLDHTRDFLHSNPLGQNPTDLATTSPALFMTRWITHLCAPTFVFLSGTSAYLSMQNHANFSESRRFLFTRGLWLVFVNFTINNFAIFWDIHFSVLFSQVIAVMGFGFIDLGLLLKLSPRTLGILGLVIIFGHDLFQGISFPQSPALNVVWTLFMGVNFFQITPNLALLISYPIIPWLGIMLVGFSFGTFLNLPSETRKKLFLQLGLGALALFALIRTFNIYGDASHWAFQKNGLFSFLSFINTSKYPPSLLFTLMTLGISLVLLSVFDTVQNKVTDTISVIGKVPLFYWLLHWFVVHFVAMGVFLAQGFHFSDLQFTGMGFGRPKEGGGLPLLGVHIAWWCIVIFLDPIAKWYGDYKRTHPEKTWLRYL
jgi:uncharacterized membrane protein